MFLKLYSTAFVEEMVAELKKVGNDKVVLGLSGGVDSTAAVLLHQVVKSLLYFCK
jgi:GMP synthase (glutamine-hydrolysing)